MRSLFILAILLFLTSCGKTPDEEVNEAIDIALTHLSHNKCEAAIDVLEDVGRDKENPIYLQVLASAYACRAKFSELDFFDTELDKIDTSTTGLMKSLTTLKWSDQDEADQDDYVATREALDILLNVDSSQPSQAAREDKYGIRKAGDMGVQALFLALSQLGKFVHFYGNVNATGVKGGGTASTDEQGATVSTCFAQYTSSDAQTALTPAIAGACRYPGPATFVGHPNLSFAAPDLAATKRRMCEGLMLVTNIMDILENMTLSDDTFGDLSTISATIQTYKTTITNASPALGTLINTTSQSSCETLVAGATEFDNLQYIYALLFEVGLQ